jgi:hypothetical protein
MLRTWLVVPIAALVGTAVAAPAAGQPAPPRSVVCFAADEGDPRLALSREAVAFWNGTLRDLGLARPFLEPEVVVRSPHTRLLQTYANRVSGDGWRLYPGAPGLEPPAEFGGIAGDILILLSTQRILSFSWPIAGRSRYLIGIRSDRIPPMNDLRAARNVIAHEIGHTLGLTHNTGTHNLMCGSCEMLPAPHEDAVFLPLLDEDRARLRALDGERGR